MLYGRHSSTEPLSSARNPILTVRSTEVVRLALSSGHPTLRHCPPLGPWALPRRSPLCESPGPGAGRPIQLTTARFKSTVTLRTFWRGGPTRTRAEALPFRYSHVHRRHGPRCFLLRTTTAKIVIGCKLLGPTCRVGTGRAPPESNFRTRKKYHQFRTMCANEVGDHRVNVSHQRRPSQARTDGCAERSKNTRLTRVSSGTKVGESTHVERGGLCR